MGERLIRWQTSLSPMKKWIGNKNGRGKPKGPEEEEVKKPGKIMRFGIDRLKLAHIISEIPKTWLEKIIIFEVDNGRGRFFVANVFLHNLFLL